MATAFPSHNLIVFRSPAGEKQWTGDLDSPKETESPENGWGERKIVCRQCSEIITSAKELISVQGAHEHTFANPDGVVFQIGCFRTSPGCTYIGEATEKWSWFRGFSWRVALCRGCLTHLGWLYRSAAGDLFHGLILDRLVFPDEDS